MNSSPNTLRDRDIFILAVAFGLLGGLAEAAKALISYFVFHKVSDSPVFWEYVWLVPASAIIWLLLLAVLLVGLARLAGGLAAKIRGATPFIFCTVIVYSLGRALSLGLYPAAVFVLSLGIATSLMRLVRNRPERLPGVARRVAIAGVVMLSLFAVSLPLARKISFLHSSRSQADSGTNRPNVLLITWDTVRAASTSLYGHERPTTPNLEKLAAKAVVFDQAISAAPWTLPSHASLFTGLYPHEHSANRNSPLAQSDVTIAEALGKLGYQTGGFIANTYWVGSGFGLNQGFDWYEDRPPFTVEEVLSSWYMGNKVVRAVLDRLGSETHKLIMADRINRSFLRWLDDRNQKRPFFAFLNFFDAHDPYLPPEPFGFRFSEHTPRSRWSYLSDEAVSPRELAELREAYDACIYYLDSQLQSLLTELQQRGVLENTIVILTADHGETIGEQSPRVIGHENNIYYDVLHVPLMIYWPAGLSGKVRVKTPVSLVDVGATIVDLVGGNSSALGLHGRSLSPLFRTPDPSYAPRTALSEGTPTGYHMKSTVWPMAKGPLHSLVIGDRHYIVNIKGKESLFDLSKDPWELNDLADTPEGQGLLPSFRSSMTAALAKPAAPPSARLAH